MPAQERVFTVVSAAGDKIVLRALRDCTREEFLAALPVSKAMRKRFAVEVPPHIAAGEEVVLTLSQPSALVSAPASNTLAHVLWHDRFALVANKPARLLVHGDGTQADTLTAHVQASVCQIAAQKGWSYAPAPQAINRLDVDTSGLVLFCLTTEFQPAFDALVANHGPHLHKRYLAIVEGKFPQGPLTIDAPIARDRHDARRMRVGKTGKPAKTRVACLDHRAGQSLVSCELYTGRRHQIRVHLAHAGHPIVGDALYGREHPAGLMLHAYALEFIHPLTGERVSLATDWPGRFTKLFSPRKVDWTILKT